MTKMKICIIGSEKSGKSTISNILYDENFKHTAVYRPTVGVRILQLDKVVRNLSEDKDELIDIELWDLSGDLKYESIWQVAMKDCDGIIIVGNFERNDENSKVENWINNFPKKMKLGPNYCLGLATHVSGVIPSTTENINVLSMPFNRCCYEQRHSTTIPFFDAFASKVLKKINQTKTSE